MTNWQSIVDIFNWKFSFNFFEYCLQFDELILDFVDNKNCARKQENIKLSLNLS